MLDLNLLKYYTPEQISDLKERLEGVVEEWLDANQVNRPRQKVKSRFEELLEQVSQEIVYQYQVQDYDVHAVDAFRRTRRTQ